VGASEKSILNDTLVAVSAVPETLAYRNNTGSAWQGRRVDVSPGQTVVVQPGMVILAAARFISFGLPGSADIMGASGGRPLAIETKTLTGTQQELQRNFERAWIRAGGLYILVRSPQEAVSRLAE
jgi:hypothetical protein